MDNESNLLGKAYDVGNDIINSPVASGLIGAAVGGTLVGAAVGIASRSKKKRRSSRKSSRKKSKRHSRRRSHKARRSRRRHTPHTAGKRKDHSTRRIRYTKNGQPYVLMRSGKARFISLKSAKSSHRRKGGRY